MKDNTGREISRMSTKYKGVLDRNGRFQAYLNIATLGGRKNRINLRRAIGTYNTPEEAYIARIKYIDSLK